MGYHIFIMRFSSGLQGPGVPISEEEWLEVVSSDSDLSTRDREVVWAAPQWSAPRSDEDASTWRSPTDSLLWSDGAVSVKNPSDAWRRKMATLAKQLRARVVGEGGEEYE